MGVLGLVVEYNPFHNGHMYHLKESMARCGADAAIAVMSGNFVQRGEPAVAGKWARTRMALEAGIDLVIELPAVYAVSSAESFAFGAVRILDSLGVVDSLCFGSENGDIDQLSYAAGILYDEPDRYKEILRQMLDKGMSFPSAREAAFIRYTGFASDADEPGPPSLLRMPNNILGVEYLKALKKLSSRIKPYTIARTGSSHGSAVLEGAISSASSIRKRILSYPKALTDEIARCAIPSFTASILDDEFKAGRGPVGTDDISPVMLALLRRMDKTRIASLPYVSEGLENRISGAVEESGCMEELVGRIVSKRYTRTRIQRSLIHALTGLTGEELKKFDLTGGPQYIRILGFNQSGRRLLSRITKAASLPVITKTADFKNNDMPLVRRMLEIEAMSTDMYVLAYKNKSFRKSGQEFRQSPIRI